MSDFGVQLKRFAVDAQVRTQEAFANTASAAHSSIQNGDPRTGSVGQPVDTGNLKASWQLNFVSALVAEVTTNVVYAKSIEDGVSYAHGGTPITFRSAVGGPHSLKQTVAAIQRLADDEARKLNQ